MIILIPKVIPHLFFNPWNRLSLEERKGQEDPIGWLPTFHLHPSLRFGDGDGRKEGSRHASSPSNSGKTVEKPSVIHTRR